MKVVHFIVNPIAGKGKPVITAKYLSHYFEKKEYSIIVKHSRYKGHAKFLTEQSLREKASIIVACGGDGTINEVASRLVHTKTALGIIPIGSGNGLARNLNIPMNIDKAIAIIKNNKTLAIDVGKVNDDYFFSNMGMGFLAKTISNFERLEKRRFTNYLKAFLLSIPSYKSNVKYLIRCNGKEKWFQPFFILVSNTNELGYNVSLTKRALLDDGLFDIVIIDKLNPLKLIYLLFLFLIGTENKVREHYYCKTGNAVIEIKGSNTKNTPYQIDGEFKNCDSKHLHLEILVKRLIVLVP